LENLDSNLTEKKQRRIETSSEHDLLYNVRHRGISVEVDPSNAFVIFVFTVQRAFFSLMIMREQL